MLHQNYSDISARFEDAQDPLLKWFRQLNSITLMQLTIPRIFTPVESAYGRLEVDTDQLSNSLTQAYLNNYRIVKALAQSYKFDYYFFWQPHILSGNKTLTKD